MDLSKNQPQPEAKLHFLDYWRIIRIRKAIIITVFLITAIIATAVTFILPPSYASTARIKIEQDSGVIPGMEAPGPSASYDPYFIQTEYEIMQDQQVLGMVVSNLDLNDVWGKKYANGETFKTPESIQLLKQRISLSPVRNTTLIDITVYGDEPNEAAQLANAIADAYRDYRREQQRQQTMVGIKALQDKYDDDELKIQAMHAAVDTLRTNLHVDDPNPDDSSGPPHTLTQEQVEQFNELMVAGKMSYTEDETKLNELKKLDTNELRDVLPGMSQDAELSTLLGKLHESEEDFVMKTNDLGMDNPEVIKLKSAIAELNQQIDNRVGGIMITLEDNAKAEKAKYDSLVDEVEADKQKDLEEAARGAPYWQAKQNLQNMIELHKLVGDKVEEEEVDLDIPKTNVVTIERVAEPGKSPVKPDKTLNIILGLVSGLLVGIGLAFFIEYLDTSVKTIDDVERALQAPVIGVIPQNVGHLLDEGPDSRHAEAYRVLRTNIMFSRKDEKLNTIVIVSAGAGEGKSTTAINLATVFAQAGNRVLIVDSDLRRPTLHKFLKVGNSIGLTNYLLKQNTLEEVIQTTSVPTLHLMASGKLPNSSMSILNSPQMKDMIAELKRRYDFVLFDSPPILGVSDASILASEMDMVIQVIQYRRYPQPMNIRAKQSIEKVGGMLVGIVLNNINMSQDESYYYYSGYYHNYYYSRTEDEQEAAAQETSGGETGAAEIKQKY